MVHVRRGFLASLSILAVMAAQTGCDDPASSPDVGGLVLVIRTIETATGSRYADVAQVTIAFDGVEVLHRTSATGDDTHVWVDSQPRTITLRNQPQDLLVAQYQVPVGFVSQIRVHATAVTLQLKQGTVIDLQVDNPTLPSWRQTGWKIAAENGSLFPVTKDGLTGVRGLLHFDDRFVRPPENSPASQAKGKGNGPTWKMKPTLAAELFQVNPPLEEPGVFLDQVTVVFRRGTPESRVLEINAAIGATVRMSPQLANWYRMKLSATTNLEQATAYYKSQPEVVAVMPAVNFGVFQLNANDATQPNYDISHIKQAWEHVQNTAGRIGSYRVRVGMIEGSPDITHPDLYRNIGINQGELPWRLFDANGNQLVDPAEVAAHDFDPPGAPDGVISIRDLEDPRNAAIRPADFNGNGRVDGEDLVNDPRWADGGDTDGNGFTDDLVGWNFITRSNRLGTPDYHATMVAGLIAAEGNNGAGIAGVNWRVSLFPLVAGVGTQFRPDVAFANAVRYAELLHLEVINTSQGWHFLHEDADWKCGQKRSRETVDIPADVFWQGRDEAAKAYADLFPTGTASLWVFAGGNNGFYLQNNPILLAPAAPIHWAIPNNVLVVGGAASATAAADWSNYAPQLIEVFAPGANWTSLTVGGGTRTESGTSFAAPTVAGAAALYNALHPTRIGSELRQAILSSSDAVIGIPCDDPSLPAQRLLNVDRLVRLP